MNGFTDWTFMVVATLLILFVAEPVTWWIYCSVVDSHDIGFRFSFFLMLHWLVYVVRIAVLILAPVIAIAYLLGKM